ncbi:MAG: NHL repeat-containing protein [Myxococcota bacterium]
MSDHTHVPLVRGGPGAPSAERPPPALAEAGPKVVLGGADPLVGSVEPTRTSLYGPRGVCALSSEGPLWVADTGHHRLLGWRALPTEDGTPADWVLGQPDFESEGRNANVETSASTLNVPTGVAPYGEHGLVVADAWNNRVLIWFEAPTASHVPADVVLGQLSFEGDLPNHGDLNVGAADRMHWPFAVLVHEGCLYVADTGNRRVLVWDPMPGPGESSRPADRVLGQPDLTARSDNAGLDEGADARTLRWPHALTIVDGHLAVADAGNNRVQLFALPVTDFAPAVQILGQADASKVDHNQSGYWPTASAVNMPYGAVATGDASLLVADTANSRILRFDDVLTGGIGADATALSGQDHFRMKGDNRWGIETRDSLCWPYNLAITGDLVLVADTGNHRIQLWERA